jgi:hypothetical protein
MIHYRRLDLPRNFLKNDLAPSIFDFKGGYNLYSFSEVLSQEVIECLKKIPLQENYVAVFTNNNKETTVDKRMIHSDIMLNTQREWQDIICGIHYEFDDTDSVFSWWNMKSVKKIFPISEKDDKREIKFQRLNGIHFEKRGSLGIPNTCELIESVNIDGPMLVRTDIPHTVVYKNLNRNRYSFSLRFKENYSNWNEALEIFKPIIV